MRSVSALEGANKVTGRWFGVIAERMRLNAYAREDGHRILITTCFIFATWHSWSGENLSTILL